MLSRESRLKFYNYWRFLKIFLTNYIFLNTKMALTWICEMLCVLFWYLK